MKTEKLRDGGTAERVEVLKERWSDWRKVGGGWGKVKELESGG